MKKSNTTYRWMKILAVGLILTMSLVWFSDCGQKGGEAEGEGTGISQEEPKDNSDNAAADPDDSKADDESNDGTEAGDDNSGGTNTGSGTSTGNNAGSGTGGTATADTCTIQINCSLLAGKDLSGTGLETLVPSNGIILGTTKVTLKPGDTVYDVTLRVTQAQKIHMVTEGSEAMGSIYVSAIANIFEKSYNSRSGWVYLINGVKPAIGSSAQKLKAGDKLVWAYTLDSGNDL